ncbi:MAG: glycosyl hydrolase [Bacteroidia bacterium]|nr:glycosyl hydrolase [Bacteroidia bacterium]
MKLLSYLFLSICLLGYFPTYGQQAESSTRVDSFLSKMEYRFVGPYRGGRSTAVSGVPAKPYTFYMGSTGGGVWKTTDAGQNWTNLSDGQIACGSIGSIAVSSSVPSTIFVGTGSDSPRGNVSAGIGIYKSLDEGKSWKHMGLKECGQIGDVIIHPQNPDLVYVAALGNVFRPNKERGVYRSTDGGENWEQVLFLNDTTGAVDIAMDPVNPEVLYAGMWRVERKPWTLIDGGMTGGLYKSVDGGDSWKKIENGLPTGLIGKIGIAISPVNHNRIWVIQQAAKEEAAGVYRSDDGGKSFSRINRDHNLRQRGWYYSRIFADPKDENTVYVTNVNFFKSIDGGENFSHRYRVPHGDTHDLWINPNDPNIMINSNDGGATISLNAGKTWSTQNNQPTSEFYRLTIDNQFPYRLYAGQQDNTTISVPSRTSGGLDPKQAWLSVGGGESADITVHPNDPNIIYATTYSGIITRVNLKTNERRDVGAYPHYTEGTEQRNLKYRWQWNFPIRISKHDPTVIYHTSNYVHKSNNEGQSWEIISPDLTQDIDAYQDIPGGPIQHDATGVEVYSSIFAFEESPTDPNTLWAGSDDGKLHITTDGGESWNDITPPSMPEEGTINSIELSPHADGRAFIAVYRYRDGDFKPYIFQTDNHGMNWQLLTDGTNGIPADHFVRVVCEDPKEKGLLYAGTEFGMYLSFDEGRSWQSFQQNLPHTPITDMEIYQNDLIISTQGRGFWIMDDLSPIYQLANFDSGNKDHLLEISDTYRSNLGGFRGNTAPDAAPYRAEIHFYLTEQDTNKAYTLEIWDEEGRSIKKLSNKDEKEPWKISKGMNSWSWNLLYPAPELLEDLVMMDMRYPGSGQRAATGNYTVRIDFGGDIQEQSFRIKKDPRWEVSDEDLKANFSLAEEVKAVINQSQNRIRQMRKLRKQLDLLLEEGKENKASPEIKTAATQLRKNLLDLEDMIYQRKVEVSQDEINYPRLFTNHIIRLYRVIIGQNARPSGGELERWADLKNQYRAFDIRYMDLVNRALPEFRQLIEDAKMKVFELE